MSTPDQPTLGALLQRARGQKGLSRKAAAAQIGCSDDSLERWEKDAVVPWPQYWEGIAGFLGLPYDDLAPRLRLLQRAKTLRGEQRVRDIPIASPYLKQGAQPVEAYFPRAPFDAARAALRSAREARRGGVILFGPMLVGKTRMALEALKAEAPEFLLLLWSSMTRRPTDFAAFQGKDVVWLLDDLHELCGTNEVWQTMEALDQLQASASRLIVVATCRSGEDEQAVKKRSAYNPLIEYLNLVELRLQPMHAAEQEWARFLAFAEALVRQEAIPAFERQFFDGTPGSVLLGLKRRTETVWDLTNHALAILKAMALLRKARVYSFSEARVCRVAERVFGMPEDAWPKVSSLLHETGWIRIGPGDVQGESSLYLPIDAYLDVCLVQSGAYPRGGRRIEDDFPALAAALGGQRPDAEALFKLSEALWYDRGGQTWAEWNELAWECARQGLAALDAEREPVLWAEGHYVLGIAFWRRWQGKEQENLQQGIAALNAALQVFTREAAPTRWAAIHKWLGTQYRYLLAGGKQNNLDQAIWYYHQALRVASREANASEWANLQYNLGLAHLHRTRGGRAANLDQAIGYASAAMDVFTHAEYPTERARALMLLAEAHLAGPYANALEHQQEAIVYLEQALAVRTREQFPYDWALTQILLGVAYRLLQADDPAANSEMSIARLEAARDALGAGYEGERSRALAELGRTYAARVNGLSQDNLAQARACYEEALAIQRHLGLRQRPGTAYDKALLHERLALDALAGGDHETAAAERQTALELLREALEIYTAEDFPEEYDHAQAALARITRQ